MLGSAATDIDEKLGVEVGDHAQRANAFIVIAGIVPRCRAQLNGERLELLVERGKLRLGRKLD